MILRCRNTCAGEVLMFPLSFTLNTVARNIKVTHFLHVVSAFFRVNRLSGTLVTTGIADTHDRVCVRSFCPDFHSVPAAAVRFRTEPSPQASLSKTPVGSNNPVKTKTGGCPKPAAPACPVFSSEAAVQRVSFSKHFYPQLLLIPTSPEPLL